MRQHPNLRNAVMASSQRSHTISLLDENTSVDEILKEIHTSEINWSNHWFLPIDALEKIVGKATNNRCSTPKLFAVLVLVEKLHDIGNFTAQSLSDTNLPFVLPDQQLLSRRNTKLHPHNHKSVEIEAMRSWDYQSIEGFAREQWSVLAPFFDKSQLGINYEFDDNTIFPFTLDEEKIEGKSLREPMGAQGVVWKVRIHNAHHNFGGDNELQYFAIKRLFSKSRLPFEQESKMLRAFAGNPEVQIISLRATYTWKRAHHLIFQWANMNLNEYWKKTELPRFTRDSVLWMLKECMKIAEALHCMHDYRNSPFYKAANDGKPSQDPTFKEDLEEFARHGDIKPSNILCASTSSGDPRGKLILADFGLSTFHTSETKSDIAINTGPGTFLPPEVELEKKTSLRYDVWSLGCVYLHFITWIISGSEGVSLFSYYRKERSQADPETLDDCFYTILKSYDGSSVPSVRKCVWAWSLFLRRSSRSCKVFNEFLDLILTRMLLVNEKERISAGDIMSELRKLHSNALEDPAYLAPALSTTGKQLPRPSDRQSVLSGTIDSFVYSYPQTVSKDLSTKAT